MNQREDQVTVIVKIKDLAARERRITAEILDCIREINVKKIFLELGYPSLLEFLVRECGYSESAAMRRISSARLLQELPEIRRDLQSGDLNLTQMSVLAQAVRQSEKVGSRVTLEKKKEVLEAIRNKRSGETQVIAAQMLELPVVTVEKVRTQADASSRVELVLTKDEMEMVKKAREILGHVKPGMSLKDLLVHLAEEVLRKKDPAREVKPRISEPAGQKAKLEASKWQLGQNLQRMSGAALGQTARKHTGSSVGKSAGKSESLMSLTGNVAKNHVGAVLMGVKKAGEPIRASVRRYVFQRDRVCQWVDAKTGRKCESHHLLEIDHVKARWAGGGNEVENLRVLCRAHNQWRYKMNA